MRQWFAHDPKKWQEFKSRYAAELEKKRELLVKIKQIEKEKETVTLLYSTKETEYNNAVALSAILKKA